MADEQAFSFSEVDIDPKPATKRRGRKPQTTVTRELKEELGGALLMLSGIYAMRDPTCGQVAMKQSAAIAEDIVNIAADHPAMLRWLKEASKATKYTKLLTDLQPLLLVVYMHHMKGAVPQTDGMDLNAVLE